MSVVLALLIGVLAATGTALLLQRSLTRIVLGIGLLANAANLLVLAASAEPADAPIVGNDGPLGDPVPQALILTAIVIGFALVSFLLAVAYRAWTISGNDEVEDDIEDRRLAAARRAREVGEAGGADADADVGAGGTPGAGGVGPDAPTPSAGADGDR